MKIIVSLASIFCLLLPLLGHAQEWKGFLGLSLTAGGCPFDMTTGDFNDDGITDLVIANAGSHNVSVMLGNGSAGMGNGTFAAVVNYTTAERPRSVAKGDFNDDGICDLVTANYDSDNVSILLGNGIGGVGDGTFATAVNYTTANTPETVTTGDFNGDGISDLATANYLSNNVSILLGNDDGFGSGDGTFSVAIHFAVGNRPTELVTGDFNGDDIIDLVTVNSFSNNLSVLLGNGSAGTDDWTFASAVSYTVGSKSLSVISGDFNGDDITDLATPNINNDRVSVLLGNDNGFGIGDGTFAARIEYFTGSRPSSIATGDFNSDGITDLATTNIGSYDISVLLGNDDGFGSGDGTFAAPVNYAALDLSYNLSTADFNGDGITDLVTSGIESGTVLILPGNGSNGMGDGTFATSAKYAAGEFPVSVATGDFDGDGITDIATANSASSNVSVLLGNGNSGVGDGTFTSPDNYAVGERGRPQSVATGDFNEDGIIDLATANGTGNSASVLMGNGTAGVGDGTFAAAVNYTISGSPERLAVGDFDNNGIEDLATANVVGNSVSVLLGNGIGGVGDGTFAAAVDFSVNGRPRSVTVGDFDNNGITDIVISYETETPYNVLLMLGNGSTGLFDSRDYYAAGISPKSVTTGDFNDDGITDLATANSRSDDVSVLLGNGSAGVGDGTFESAVNYATGIFPESVTTGDFNDDGITDLTTANSESYNISVLLGNGSAGVGNGTFTTPVSYYSGNGPASVKAGDFNGDGIYDLVVANSYSLTVCVLLNLGFSEPLSDLNDIFLIW